MKSSIEADRSAAAAPAGAIRDITAEEAAEWVTDEFHSLGDIHAIQARISLEEEIVAANAHKAAEFPTTQFAHETLLAELRAEFTRQAVAMVAEQRILH